MHLIGVFFDNLAGDRILLINNSTDLAVYFLHRRFRDMRRFSHGSTKEDFALVFGVDHWAQDIRHPITRHHIPGKRSGALKIV